MVITAKYLISNTPSSPRSESGAALAPAKAPVSLAPFFDVTDDLFGIAGLASGRWQKTNSAFLVHLGYSDAEMEGLRVSSLVHPDDLLYCETAARDLGQGRTSEFTSRMRMKSGRYCPVSWRLVPNLESGLVYCVGRPLQREQSSPDPREGQLALQALAAARAFSFTWDRASDRLDLDGAAEALLGRPPHAFSRGSFYLSCLDDADHDALRTKIAATTEQAPRFEACYRFTTPSGSTLWIEERGRVVFEGGRKARIVGLCRDVTERKAVDDSTELVNREMAHRAKNILAVVQAVLQFTKADTVEAYAAAIRHRVQALARVQGLLAAEQWTGADLVSVIAAEFEPFGGLDGARLSADGPPVRIAPHALQTLSLIIHELATNAAKHGALTYPEGRISLTWTAATEGLVLVWRETGGPPARPPERKGFGHLLVTASLAHIGGDTRLDFRPEGLEATLTLPAAALTQARRG